MNWAIDLVFCFFSLHKEPTFKIACPRASKNLRKILILQSIPLNVLLQVLVKCERGIWLVI